MGKEMEDLLKSHKSFTKERNWDSFQSPKNLCMALSVETAELMEIFTWLSERQSYSLSDDQFEAASDEIADIFLYLLRLSDVLGVDIIEASKIKMIKNIKKHPAPLKN